MTRPNDQQPPAPPPGMMLTPADVEAVAKVCAERAREDALRTMARELRLAGYTEGQASMRPELDAMKARALELEGQCRDLHTRHEEGAAARATERDREARFTRAREIILARAKRRISLAEGAVYYISQYTRHGGPTLRTESIRWILGDVLGGDPPLDVSVEWSDELLLVILEWCGCPLGDAPPDALTKAATYWGGFLERRAAEQLRAVELLRATPNDELDTVAEILNLEVRSPGQSDGSYRSECIDEIRASWLEG